MYKNEWRMNEKWMILFILIFLSSVEEEPLTCKKKLGQSIKKIYYTMYLSIKELLSRDNNSKKS